MRALRHVPHKGCPVGHGRAEQLRQPVARKMLTALWCRTVSHDDLACDGLRLYKLTQELPQCKLASCLPFL